LLLVLLSSSVGSPQLLRHKQEVRVSETLAVDYAWQHPAPQNIRQAGYHGALRYLSNDPTKNLTAHEAAALHAAGLWVAVVWETTAQRAGAGNSAGAADIASAEKQAAAIGYPRNCVIFYACDYDADPAKVMPYFNAVASHSKHAFGVYGSFRVVEAVKAKHPRMQVWQASAWSQTHVSKHANLYQRQRTTHKIGGAASGWDEDVVLAPVSAWQPGKPAPTPVPTPAPPHPANPDHVMWVAAQTWAKAKGLH
jgi:hypothetical protein